MQDGLVEFSVDYGQQRLLLPYRTCERTKVLASSSKAVSRSLASANYIHSEKNLNLPDSLLGSVDSSLSPYGNFYASAHST